MTTANLIEIYTSLQGEGPHVGEPMVFVRFQDCALSCQFCDTPGSFQAHAKFRYEVEPLSGRFQFQSNPITSEELTKLLSVYALSTLSITGGEPLQHGDFLAEWLPQLKRRYRILLETNGILPRALACIIDDVDIVSMDMKLPSVTGMKEYWEEHEEFLKIACEKEVYVKVVVSTPTKLSELKQALEIVERVAPHAPFILQPVTPAWKVQAGIPEAQLRELYDFSRGRLSDVRVIPQVHAMLGII